jgi:hypothetical protein
MILDDIATYLQTNSTRLTVGVNLTKGHMPDSPSTVTTLYEITGFSSVFAFSTGSGTRVYEQPSLMIHSRSTDYQTARLILEDVFTILDGVNNRGLPTTTGVRYAGIDAVQPPFDIGTDSNDRHKLSVNFNVIKTTG